jgi:hypothetical protein
LVLILNPGVAPDSLSSDPPTLGFLGFLGFQYPPLDNIQERAPSRRSQLGQVPSPPLAKSDGIDANCGCVLGKMLASSAYFEWGDVEQHGSLRKSQA